MYKDPIITHLAKVLIAKGPPLSLANIPAGSRAFGQFKPIRRLILALGDCGGKSSSMLLRCFPMMGKFRCRDVFGHRKVLFSECIQQLHRMITI